MVRGEGGYCDQKLKPFTSKPTNQAGAPTPKCQRCWVLLIIMSGDKFSIKKMSISMIINGFYCFGDASKERDKILLTGRKCYFDHFVS